MNIEKCERVIFSYFYATRQMVVEAAQKVLFEGVKLGRYVFKEDLLTDELFDVCNQSSDGTKKKIAILFAPDFSPDECVFITNLSDGWFTLVNCICAELKVKCITVSLATDKNQYPCNAMRIYEGGKEVRYVRAMLDSDRWDFFEKGESLPFEEESNYRKHRIKDRVNKQLLLGYLKSLKLDVYVDSFWMSQSSATYIFGQ